MRIFFGLDLGVVLAVHRHPLLGDHAGGEPAPEAEEVRNGPVQVHATVGLAAMQVQRHRENGELGHDQHVDQHGQPTGVRQAVGQEIEYCIKHGKHPGV
jgi:hypothetical protein